MTFRISASEHVYTYFLISSQCFVVLFFFKNNLGINYLRKVLKVITFVPTHPEFSLQPCFKNQIIKKVASFKTLFVV